MLNHHFSNHLLAPWDPHGSRKRSLDPSAAVSGAAAVPRSRPSQKDRADQIGLYFVGIFPEIQALYRPHIW